MQSIAVDNFAVTRIYLMSEHYFPARRGLLLFQLASTIKIQLSVVV
jgi:hypothetical protein